MCNRYYNIPDPKVAIGEKNLVIAPDYIAIEGMNASRGATEKAKAVFILMGFDGIFGHRNYSHYRRLCNSFRELIYKMRSAGLIEVVTGFSKGKYKSIQ